MRTYPEYKDSGVEWIGEIPKEWDHIRLKYLSNIKTGDKNTEDSEEEGEFPFFVRSQTVEKISTYSFDGEAILTAGDGVGVGKVFHYFDGRFDYHQRVYKFSDFYKLSGKFLFYYMKENLFNELLRWNAKSTVDSVRLPFLQNFMVPLPPLSEQKQISDYLDRKTQQIDDLIEKTERKIELLTEQRSSLINQCVTKGLDPNVEMKDSGVEWIGEIPTHWLRGSFKYFVKNITDGAHVSPDLSSPDKFFVSTVDINNGIIDFGRCLKTSSESYDYLVQTGCKPNKNDILFSKDGTIGKTSIVKDEDFVVASSLIIIKPIFDKVGSGFLNYILQSSVVLDQIEGLVRGAALRRVSLKNIKSIGIIGPPLSEQKQISEHLDTETSKIDQMVDTETKRIDLLKEYRQSLISNVVTGKIDVRDEVIQ
ncbi:MAG: type I restriction endonuclease subunit S [Rhodospirillaceae bacterium]|nr:type I restriction endonuclease subunit S [Rhodospirillaceae bacterium]|tara:strand:+ start:818 stop:2083 length:1266 start_codon:yes stop_codon:yes gene_type:complete